MTGGMIKKKPSLLWVYSGSLAKVLDKATWLETAAELAGIGWDVTLVASGFPPEGVEASIRMVSIPWPKVYFVGYSLYHLQTLRYLLKNHNRLDVILFHPPTLLFLFPMCLLGRLFHVKVPRLVLDFRTVPMTVATFRSKLQNHFFGFNIRVANYWVDGQTAITCRLAKALGIPDRLLLGVWPSGVGLEQFEPAKAGRMWSTSESPIRLVYIGTVSEERHLLELCQAVHMVRREGLDVVLTVVGDGRQRAELEIYAQEHDLGAIEIKPAVPYTIVPELLMMADVGVLPFPNEPKFQVSSPIKLFEYLAAGMPVLATRIVCHTDVLGDTDCVFWADDATPVALAIAIREVCARKLELAEMGHKSAKIVQAWTWEESAKKLDKALQASFHT